VKNLLREKANRGAAVFMSTHLLDVAEEIADRIGIVDRGRLLCVGTLDELRQSLSQQHTSLEQLFLEVTAASAEGIVSADGAASAAALEHHPSE